MSSFFAGGLLILLLQLPIVLRPIFFKKPRIDAIVMFLPISVIITGLYLFAFGLHFFSILLSILVLLVFFTNFRAMLRFKNKLFVDHYSFPFCAASFIEFLVILALSVILVLYCPVADMELSLNFKSKPVFSVTKTMYTGSAYRGMQERERFFDPVNAVLYTYSPSVDNSPSTNDSSNTTDSKDSNLNEIFLCIGGCCADQYDYTPLLRQLAQEGYTSLILETNADDIKFSGEKWDNSFLRPFMMRVIYKNNPERYQKLSDEFYSKKLIEAQVLIDIAKQRYPESKLYILTDDFPANMISGAFPEYTNIPLELNGCGLIALTKPAEAVFVNHERWGRKNREENFKLPVKLTEYIKKSMDNGN